MAAGEASVQSSTGSLLQAEGGTCEDFQDEDSSSSSPDSSFSPFDGDLTTTSSSVFVDSLTTEGKSGAEPPPWSITVPDGDYLREEGCSILSHLRLQEWGHLLVRGRSQV